MSETVAKEASTPKNANQTHNDKTTNKYITSSKTTKSETLFPEISTTSCQKPLPKWHPLQKQQANQTRNDKATNTYITSSKIKAIPYDHENKFCEFAFLRSFFDPLHI